MLQLIPYKVSSIPELLFIAEQKRDSHNIPLTHLHEHLSEVPLDRPVVVHCEGGYRSAIACSLLAKAGLTNVKDLVGGIKAWIATKLPTVPENTMTCATKICETAA